jgi:hypothetical protein
MVLDRIVRAVSLRPMNAWPDDPGRMDRAEPLHLTDLQDLTAGVRRAAHGFATSGTWRRLATRGFVVVREVLGALPRDVWRGLRRPSAKPLRMEQGIRSATGTPRVALYVHYSATGLISDMVRFQLRQLEALGFAIVFITMAAHIPEDDWQAIRQICALVVQRRNFGLDFGAWRDLLPEVRRRWPAVQEMMLANDSVLGPIRPLAPLIAVMRAGGDGLFGLTESLQGGAHLQSYMLLARGATVVDDLMRFIGRLHISHSKWLLVQLGEVRLARWMQRRGHRVAALFGYDRVVRLAVADCQERGRLIASHRRLRALNGLSDEAAARKLHDWPLNPTHHLWHVLATRFQSPFLKTELIRRNPGRLPGVGRWADVVPIDSPCPLPVIEAHLETLKVR